MKPKLWGNEYRSTTVCVDSYENGILAGQLFNSFLDTGQQFESLSQFLFQMEELLDTIGFPQSYTEPRIFSETIPRCDVHLSETKPQRGRLASFVVKILFRQNASWQGLVIWQEGGKEQSFRSALELIFLIDSALRESDIPNQQAIS